MAPTAPTRLSVEHTKGGDNLTWSGAIDRSDGNYLLYNVYASTDELVDITRPQNLIAIRKKATQLSIRRKAGKPLLHYAVTALDRYGNESEPIRWVEKSKPAIVVTTLLANNGRTLTVPQRNLFDADLLVVTDMKGRTLQTYTNREQINISRLPEGMYQLRSLHKKGYTHRLGLFSIKRK